MEEENKKLEVAEEETEANEEPKDEGKPTTDPTTPEVTEEAEAEPEVAETPAAEEGQPTPEPIPEKTFTQEQVNALVGKARAEGRDKGYEQARREALERYDKHPYHQEVRKYIHAHRTASVSCDFEC